MTRAFLVLFALAGLACAGVATGDFTVDVPAYACTSAGTFSGSM